MIRSCVVSTLLLNVNLHSQLRAGCQALAAFMLPGTSQALVAFMLPKPTWSSPYG